MGVFKEHARAFETVAKKQHRIYNDSADYGYGYNTRNVPEDISTLIHYVNDLKSTSLMKSYIPYHNGVTIVFRIGWEIDEGFECGTQYTISFNKLKKSNSLINKEHNALMSVGIESYRTPYKH